MSHYPEDYLGHILIETTFILSQSPGLNKETLINDGTLVRAMVRSLEIIGEATKNIPDDFKQKYPNIPWRNMAGMRDRLIHDYFEIDYDVVWETIINNIPELDRDLRQIMIQEGYTIPKLK